ncbi:MAG TPA: hypothetical protein VNP72_03785 [Longimicrobium sp.]|nr:hypothetical protein [Longimicrobium sp.]
MMRTRMLIAAMLAVSVSAAGCTAEVKDEGRLPNVDVDVKDPGELPKVDIDPANVEITTDTQQVVTPEITTTPVAPDTN